MKRLLPLLCVLLATACLSNPRPPEYEAVVLPSGVVRKDLVVPEQGVASKPGDRVTLHYELRLGDGTLIDSSWDRGTPIEVVLGDGQLVPGIEQGLVGLRRFGRRRIVVPPELGFGEEGVADRVPPRAILYVTVELMELEPAP